MIGNCARMVELNLALNSLTGSIPRTFSSITSLNSLNLSSNKLTGLIPDSLEKLKLGSIDLSENQLSGRMQPDLLTMGGEKAFIGNKELCVYQNSKVILRSGINICTGNDAQRGFFAGKYVLFCAIASALVVILAGFLFVSYKKIKLGEADVKKDLEGEKQVDPKWKLSSFHRVEMDADEICSLEEEYLIGTGATGKVYRVDLKRNGTTVAVKQLWKADGVKTWRSIRCRIIIGADVATVCHVGHCH
ncbi:Receptor-like protein kinase HSL1 [Morella rubra]|uniref:Receptor-like protein kinase HSL1 n=1 Tax=Morella rubra TaxID=262757 RepID=A0A6A1WNE1_9ROSI|nr:Receptor-like protein kinase HSL1 [Morella rubra]